MTDSPFAWALGWAEVVLFTLGALAFALYVVVWPILGGFLLCLWRIAWIPVRLMLWLVRLPVRAGWRRRKHALFGVWLLMHRRVRLRDARQLYELMRQHRHDELYPALRREADAREFQKEH